MLNPQEKAKELANKYDKMNFHDCEDHEAAAKECALIAVDEIFLVFKNLSEDDDLMFPDEIKYWEEVEGEIKKLNYENSLSTF